MTRNLYSCSIAQFSLVEVTVQSTNEIFSLSKSAIILTSLVLTLLGLPLDFVITWVIQGNNVKVSLNLG